MKIAVISTHPVQYHAPWLRGLAAQRDVELKVYYALLPNREQQGVGFGVPFEWDVPVLEGYDWKLLDNEVERPTLGEFFGLSTPGIKSVLAKERPDAAIITGWHSRPMLQALWACIRLGIPRVVRGESNAMRRRRSWVRVLHRLLLSRFDAFLAIGESSRAFYLQYGVAEERVFPAFYFVDNARFHSQLSQVCGERGTLRAEWGIPEAHTCYLYVGKLEPKKRITDLLLALDVARRDNRAVHLLVVGDGELRGEAERFVRERGLPVTFAGFLNQTEVTRAYAVADCLVLPSDYGETWGLVVNEAMACGLPAVVSDRVGCGPDLIEEGVTGAPLPLRRR
jgi:glycosyltransferase involved in cell wall biosynthesis